MSLRTLQTRILTQPPPSTPGPATVSSYIVASFRAFDNTNPAIPTEIGNVALSARSLADVVLHPNNPNIVLVTDGVAFPGSRIYTVNVSDPTAPVILDSILF